MQEILPNKSLLRRLHATYYGSDAAPGERGASSHWRHFAGLFDVEVDADGTPTHIQGVGFGHDRWGNLVHRFLDQLCALGHILNLPDRKAMLRWWRKVARLCRSMGLDPTFDSAFQQVCLLVKLQRYIGTQIRGDSPTVLVIGDGYGVFSSLFKTRYPEATIVLVDLGKTLFFQAFYCQKAHPQRIHTFAPDCVEGEEKDFIYCPADALDALDGFRFDLAINVCSMQEMDYEAIQKYFSLMRRTLRAENLFYCCNRQSKILPDGEVIKFASYPWSEDDVILEDGPCPWKQVVLFWGWPKKGLRFLGQCVPFITFYDGPIVHRLAVMAADDG